MQHDTEPQQIGVIVARIVERASRLDRAADLELAYGHGSIADRLASLAAELRMGAAQ